MNKVVSSKNICDLLTCNYLWLKMNYYATKKKSFCDQDHKIGIEFGTFNNWEFGNGIILQLILYVEYHLCKTTMILFCNFVNIVMSCMYSSPSCPRDLTHIYSCPNCDT
jgi:hypothetical protein